MIDDYTVVICSFKNVGFPLCKKHTMVNLRPNSQSLEDFLLLLRLKFLALLRSSCPPPAPEASQTPSYNMAYTKAMVACPRLDLPSIDTTWTRTYQYRTYNTPSASSPRALYRNTSCKDRPLP